MCRGRLYSSAYGTLMRLSEVVAEAYHPVSVFHVIVVVIGFYDVGQAELIGKSQVVVVAERQTGAKLQTAVESVGTVIVVSVAKEIYFII